MGKHEPFYLREGGDERGVARWLACGGGMCSPAGPGDVSAMLSKLVTPPESGRCI